MAQITRQLLEGYLDDALNDSDTAEVERALRESEGLRRLVGLIVQERDRGEHSIGAIWRRERLSCPSRDQLGSYVLEVLEPALQDYLDFHLRTIACPYCLANLADLQSRQREAAPKVQARRKRFFESSAGLLQGGRERKR